MSKTLVLPIAQNINSVMKMASTGGESDKEKSKEFNDEESNNEEYVEYLDEKPNFQRRANVSLAWKYFDLKDQEQKIATCKICANELSYRSVSNLTKHVRRHGLGLSTSTQEQANSDTENIKLDDEESNSEEFVEYLEEKPEESRRPNVSLAWKYFEVKDRELRIATCNICSRELSYSSVSNLTKHVRRKHGLGLSTSTQDQPRNHTREGMTRSSIWHFCKKIDHMKKIAMCLVCKKKLSYKTINNLRRHVLNQHPDLIDHDKRLMISSDGNLYEIDDKVEHLINDDEQPVIDIDSVYIEDVDTEDVLESKGMRNKRRKITLHDTKISDDTSADEITYRERYARKKSDTLDQFGKYLVSIMRQLPENISNKLQLDFVKQAMTARLASDTQTIETDNSYQITIANNGPRNNSDHQYVVEEHVVE